MKYLLVSVLALSILSGCNAKHCIKIGGTYDGINGNLEYCYDQQSKEARPVLEAQNGSKLIVLTEQDAQKIVSKIEPQAKNEKSLSQQTAFVRLLSLIK